MYSHTHNSFIKCSIEAGILISGNGTLCSIVAPSQDPLHYGVSSMASQAGENNQTNVTTQ